MTAACVLVFGNTVYAQPVYSGGCHRYTNPSAGLRYRHDCINLDVDWDVACHDVEWHYGRHHNVDGNGYCLEHGCYYEDCPYVQEGGYCEGGNCWANADGGNGGSWGTAAGSEWNAPSTDAGSGESGGSGSQTENSGYGNAQSGNAGGWNGGGQGSGYCGGGQHHGNGSGHHGGRHH